jgi:hypothetical protein
MKPNQMIVVLGYNSGDAVLAERLMDWCFELAGRKQMEHPCVLVAAPNVHPELQVKVKLAAEVAFVHVEGFKAAGEIGDKITGSNRLFKAAAQIVANGYSAPWVMLEPDCVPLKRGWLNELQSAYLAQPKRFFGPHAKFMVGDQEKTCLVRTAVYPNNAVVDVSPYCDSLAPFNQLAAEVIVARSTKGRIIQQLEVRGKEDLDKIRPDAVLLHSDKTGQTIEAIRQIIAKPKA